MSVENLLERARNFRAQTECWSHGRVVGEADGLIQDLVAALRAATSDAIAAEKIAAEEAREEAFNSGPFGLGA